MLVGFQRRCFNCIGRNNTEALANWEEAIAYLQVFVRFSSRRFGCSCDAVEDLVGGF